MRKIELVFIPSPGIGHLLSTVELAKLIVRHDASISAVVLIIKLPFDSSLINSYLESQSHDSNLSGLTFLSLPPLSTPPDPSSFMFSSLVELNKSLVKQAVEDRISSGSPKPAAFVLDIFCTSLMDTADELNIPSYIYFISGANVWTLAFHFESSLADDSRIDHIISEFMNPDIKFGIPGFRNRVPSKVIPGMLLDKEFGCKMLLNFINMCKRSKGLLVNTFMELETYVMHELLHQHHEGKIPPVYPVGPILELNSKGRGTSKSRKEDEESIMKWLDQQPDSSVVFLCFGSMGTLDATQVKEIASGLEQAGHRFLWSLRCPQPEDKKLGVPTNGEKFDDALPEGFRERTTNRGKIIGWAPQVSILGHSAVGGFVSHCGWNSILESLWFGVPMAVWPMCAEQQLNAFGMVKELGIAVEIRMDYRRDQLTGKANLLVTAEEIENGVKKLMSMDKKKKEAVGEMSEHGKKALQENGSSNHWLASFIAHVLKNAAAK